MIYKVIIFMLTLILCDGNDDKWAFDNAPGIAMEYKIHIDAGKEDCYWQFVHPGATIYIAMQVLKGGDGNAGMAVRNPEGKIVHPYEWKKSAEYEETATVGGFYGVCLDNQFSRFTGKLINLYMTTFRYDLWEQYTKDLEELDVSVNNFTDSIKNVDQNIHNMLLYQSHTRSREARDYQLLLNNDSYVQYWSIGLCVSVVGTGFLQIYFVRKFFDDKRPTKSGGRA